MATFPHKHAFVDLVIRDLAVSLSPNRQLSIFREIKLARKISKYLQMSFFRDIIWLAAKLII
jgi:hypothetical protein